MATRKSAGPTPAPPAGKSEPRERADWQAIERDYRTGQFTDQELADKHGSLVTRQAINKRAKTHGWKKDLSREVRQATKASVIRAQVEQRVAQQVAEGCAAATVEATDAVLTAAEANKQVILGHRSDLNSGRKVASELLDELQLARLLSAEREILAQILAGEAAEVADIAQAQQAIGKALGLSNRVATFKAWADAITKLHVGERIAFGLDEKADDDDKTKNPVAAAVADFLQGIHGNRSGRLQFAEPRKA